ncbi:MAG TPA: NAD(P)-binding domain-containing protein [Pyrinomonadaceae bacterium]|nr:NAD(P)-binding domain-containing protein [Pyrinomonadaceae bacterium]
MHETYLLIIGAGPFGLAVAAQASHLGIEHVVIGKPMEFWRKNMPAGMYLRSACDWHLDPAEVHTIDRFLAERGQTAKDVEPLSLEFYLSYTEWFQEQKQITSLPLHVERLDVSNSEFIATTTSGDTIEACNVVIAPGFTHFTNIPAELRSRLPPGRFVHTCDFVDFSNARGKRYLIIGGRQSAFEWAALLVEAGASAIYITHRHDSPALAVADWSWVNPMVDAIGENPTWFRNLSQEEKDEVNHRLWAEGRLKVEPWLEARLNTDRVHVRPRTEVVECIENNGEVNVTLINGETITCDQIVLATGYKVDITRLPILSGGNILEQLETRNGFPVLDEHFQTSIKGLFITSMPATQDFGPFFAFTISVRVSAKLICEAL